MPPVSGIDDEGAVSVEIDSRVGFEMDLDIEYQESQPEATLSWLVWHLWEMDVRSIPGQTFSHRIVPDAGLTIVVLPGNRLFALGPRTEAIEVPVHQGDYFAGIRFQPGAAQATFGIEGDRTTGYVGPLDVLVPDLAAQLSTALEGATDKRQVSNALTVFLGELSCDSRAVDPILLAANREISTVAGALEVTTLADRLHVTPRSLQRLFKRWIGLTPKQVIRLQRFRSSATNLIRERPDSWAQVAAEGGFADQSHLIREFTDLGGSSPKDLSAQIGRIRHRGVAED